MARTVEGWLERKERLGGRGFIVAVGSWISGGATKYMAAIKATLDREPWNGKRDAARFVYLPLDYSYFPYPRATPGGWARDFLPVTLCFWRSHRRALFFSGHASACPVSSGYGGVARLVPWVEPVKLEQIRRCCFNFALGRLEYLLRDWAEGQPVVDGSTEWIEEFFWGERMRVWFFG